MTYITDVILDDTPLALWRMDESSGTFTDRSGNGLTATPVGTPSVGGGALLYGLPTSLMVAGTDRAPFTRQAGPSNTGQAFSGGAFIRTTSTDAVANYPGNAALNVLGDDSAAVGQGFGVHAGKVRFALYAGSWQYLDGATSVNDGGWHYISFSYTGAAGASGALVYVDGILDGSANLSPSSGGVSAGFNAIGNGYNVTDGFIGSLAYVWFKKSVVSAARMRAHYLVASRIGIVGG